MAARSAPAAPSKGKKDVPNHWAEVQEEPDCLTRSQFAAEDAGRRNPADPIHPTRYPLPGFREVSESAAAPEPPTIFGLLAKARGRLSAGPVHSDPVRREPLIAAVKDRSAGATRQYRRK